MHTSPRTRPISSSPILIGLLSGCMVIASFDCAENTDVTVTMANPPPFLEEVGPVGDENLLHNIEIQNLNDERLGRIHDLGVDLENGRIIEVLVETDVGLFTSGRIVAVPPQALLPDLIHQVYRLNMSKATFAAIPTIHLEEWTAEGRSNRVAAAYRYFDQKPYFVERGTIIVGPNIHHLSMLGYVDLSSRILGLPVRNLDHEILGKVATMSVDLLRGRIISVTVEDGKTKHVASPMVLPFNATRDGLILDYRKQGYSD